MKIFAENIYLIETPLQLLNAIEARNHFKLKNNHLLIHVGGTGFSVERFRAILAEQEWDSVQYINFNVRTYEFSSKLVGKQLSGKARGFCYDYQQWQNRKIIEDIAKEYGSVKNIFLGNYLAGYQEYMRHFANVLKHDNLYLLDDGTDVLIVNEQRKELCNDKNIIADRKGSFFLNMKSAIRNRLFEWDNTPAESVAFFSAYDLDTGGKDKLIRNKFEKLRELSTRNIHKEDIIFLGQCLVEDGCYDAESYLNYLSRVKDYFGEEKIVYIPHPRESVQTIEKIIETCGFEIKRLIVPIEYEFCVGGLNPKTVAAFFCSALVNCDLILGPQVKFMAFYLPPENMSRYRKLSNYYYQYIKNKCNDSIELVIEY